MKACDVALKVIKTVACYTSCGIEVNAVQALHNIGVIRDLEIGNNRFAETLIFHILRIILADRNRSVDNVRDDHHALADLLRKLGLLHLKLCKMLRELGNLFLKRLRLLTLSLCHQTADLLADGVSLAAKIIRLLLCGTALRVKLDHFVDKGKLLILKLVADVLFYNLGILPDKLKVKHSMPSFRVLHALYNHSFSM